MYNQGFNLFAHHNKGFSGHRPFFKKPFLNVSILKAYNILNVLTPKGVSLTLVVALIRNIISVPTVLYRGLKSS